MAGRLVEEKFNSNEAQCVFVGAGPVGLWTAIQIKAKFPRRKICMVERYSQYVRTQALSLDLAVFQSCPELYSRLKQRRSLNTKSILNSFSKIASAENIRIPIQDLEHCLKQYALEQGIRIIQEKRFMLEEDYKKELKESEMETRQAFEAKQKYQIILGPKELYEAFPNCITFIGADGRYSTVRQIINGPDGENLIEEDLRYLVQVKYRVPGKVQALGVADIAHIQGHINPFQGEESVRYDEEKDETAIAVRLDVDKETYEEMGKITEKNPHRAKQFFDLPKSVRDAILLWTNVRKKESEKMQIREEPILDTATLTTIKLSIYSSKRYVGANRSGKSYYLVGDAAFGLPFFRSLNAGLQCSKLLVENLDHADTLRRYSEQARALYEIEAAAARLKNTGLNATQKLVKVGAALNVIGFDPDELEQFTTTYPISGLGERLDVSRLSFFQRYGKSMLLWGAIAFIAAILTGGGSTLGAALWFAIAKTAISKTLATLLGSVVVGLGGALGVTSVKALVNCCKKTETPPPRLSPRAERARVLEFSAVEEVRQEKALRNQQQNPRPDGAAAPADPAPSGIRP